MSNTHNININYYFKVYNSLIIMFEASDDYLIYYKFIINLLKLIDIDNGRNKRNIELAINQFKNRRTSFYIRIGRDFKIKVGRPSVLKDTININNLTFKTIYQFSENLNFCLSPTYEPKIIIYD